MSERASASGLAPRILQSKSWGLLQGTSYESLCSCSDRRGQGFGHFDATGAKQKPSKQSVRVTGRPLICYGRSMLQSLHIIALSRTLAELSQFLRPGQTSQKGLHVPSHPCIQSSEHDEQNNRVHVKGHGQGRGMTWMIHHPDRNAPTIRNVQHRAACVLFHLCCPVLAHRTFAICWQLHCQCELPPFHGSAQASETSPQN